MTNLINFMSDKKEAILTVATELFSEFGYHAVGVDTVIAKSKVAKMTFYKYFPSKINLIESVLAARDVTLRAGIGYETNRFKLPLAKIKAIFGWYQHWFSGLDFHGCMFIKASEEFPEKGSAIKTISQGHKSWLAQLIQGFLTEYGVKNPRELAVHIMIVLDGLTVSCNLCPSDCEKQLTVSWKYVQHLILSQKKSD